MKGLVGGSYVLLKLTYLNFQTTREAHSKNSKKPCFLFSLQIIPFFLELKMESNSCTMCRLFAEAIIKPAA